MTTQDAYRVFLTRNSEYHVRGGLCCGVRDRRTGEFVADHAALGLQLAGTYTDELGASRCAQLPLVGEALEFERPDGQWLTTSQVMSVELRDAGGDDSLWGQMLSRRPARTGLDTF